MSWQVIPVLSQRQLNVAVRKSIESGFSAGRPMSDLDEFVDVLHLQLRVVGHSPFRAVVADAEKLEMHDGI